MNKYDAVLLGYAVNQKSGGYDGKDYSFLETIDAKYLYHNCFLDTYCAEPMPFMQLTAQAEKNGFKVGVFDGLILGYKKEDLMNVIKQNDSYLYGFSIYDSTQSDLFEVISWLKTIRPNAKVYVGGPYATIATEFILNSCKDIDYVMVGDGDESFPQLIDCVKNNKNIKDVVNIYYRNQENEITHNKIECADLNKLEHPKRLYTDFIKEKNYSLSVSSARGCGYASCAFCYLREYQRIGNQPKFRYKNPEYIFNEIKELVEKYNITKLSFCDEDFFGDKEGVLRALELFKLLIDNNIKIDLHVNARVRTVMWLAKNDLLQYCVKAGVKYMYVGLESYNDKSLKLFDKGITTEDIDYVLNELDKNKIRINPGIITFDPILNIDEVKKNVDLFKRIDYYDAFIFTRRLVLYPNASQKIKALFENKNYFMDNKVKILYDSMVKYRDEVFPLYIQLNKNIVNETNVKVIQDYHFKCFDEIYQILKDGEDIDLTLENNIVRAKKYLNNLLNVK